MKRMNINDCNLIFQGRNEHITSKTMKKGLLFILVLWVLFGYTTAVRADVGNIFRIGSDVTIDEGMTVRNVFSIGGQITIDGSVEKHVVAIGGSVVLTKTAIIGGNIVSIGGVIVRGRGAEVQGNLTEINSNDISEAVTAALSDEWEGWSWIFAIIQASLFIGILILILPIIHFIPKPIRVISATVSDVPLKAILWGIGGLILVVPLAVLLTISVIGIVLIPLEITIVFCAILLGFISILQLIGKGFFSIFSKHDHSIARETILGLIILWFIGLIPYVGWMLKVFAIVIGLGGVIITRFGTSHSR